MWGVKLVHTPDRSRQQRILERIKKRLREERAREEKQNANATN